MTLEQITKRKESLEKELESLKYKLEKEDDKDEKKSIQLKIDKIKAELADLKVDKGEAEMDEKVIIIKEEVEIPGAGIILEKGDRIKVKNIVEENLYKDEIKNENSEWGSLIYNLDRFRFSIDYEKNSEFYDGECILQIDGVGNESEKDLTAWIEALDYIQRYLNKWYSGKVLMNKRAYKWQAVNHQTGLRIDIKITK